MKIVCSITARPSFSRIETILDGLSKRKDVDLKILCSGSALADEYGRIYDIIKSKGFLCEAVETLKHGDTPSSVCGTTAETIRGVSEYLTREKPDFLITIADRFETIGAAIAASYSNVSTIHFQGGELTGNIDEKVRHAVTKLSDFHFVSNSQAARRLTRMGENPLNIFNYGCPSIDLVANRQEININILEKHINTAGVGDKLNLKDEYLVMLLHPETEEVGENINNITSLLNVLEILKIPVVIFWPNLDLDSAEISGILRRFRENNTSIKKRFIKNLESDYFLQLIKNSKCFVGNSSAGLREAGYLAVPVVNIGDRQRGRDRGENVIDVDWRQSDIVKAIKTQCERSYVSQKIYGDGNSSKKIIRKIASLKPTIRKVFYE